MDLKKIRNFSIIAHIDHGKSTLSDRIIELTHGLEKREMQNQVVDSMDIERERGITIKLNAVSLNYHDPIDNQDYVLNLIDTPGHVDFNYEVSRSLAACEGALLVVDATQGVQAQTIANTYLALSNNLEILAVINKIDLPSANIDEAKRQVNEIIGVDPNHISCISAKTGLNVDKLLHDIVTNIPCPEGKQDSELQALIFDSYYDSYRGVICFIRVKNGSIKVGQHIKMMATGKDFIVSELGIKTPKFKNLDVLNCGDVGWVSANIKTAKDIAVGDTITDFDKPCPEALPGYKNVLPMVYCGMYPIDSSKYAELKEAMIKISLSDSSLVYKYETSLALGFGIRCGFLGLLHMDVIQERIQREYKIDLILTAPSVEYKIVKTEARTSSASSFMHNSRAIFSNSLEAFLRFERDFPSAIAGSEKTISSAEESVMFVTARDSSKVEKKFSSVFSKILSSFNESSFCFKSIVKGEVSPNSSFSFLKILSRFFAITSSALGIVSSVISPLLAFFIARRRNESFRLSLRVTKLTAFPWEPARPVRPILWT